MTTPHKPTDPKTLLLIDAPKTLKNQKLIDAIMVHDALLAQGLIAVFPDDLSPDVVHAALMAHLTEIGELGTARTGVSLAVEVRRDALTRGAATYKRVLDLIDAGFPIGTTGRAGYFPTGNTDPSLGDLLIAAGKGIAAKGKPALPEGWTAQSIQDLGVEVQTALQVRDEQGRQREGHSKATAALEKRTLEIRRRLRKAVTAWFGATSSKLIAFGITPRIPPGGRRRKHPAAGGVKGSEVNPPIDAAISEA